MSYKTQQQERMEAVVQLLGHFSGILWWLAKPLAVVWGVNHLFGTGLALDAKTYLAAAFILAALRGIFKQQKATK